MDEARFVLKCFLFAALLIALSQLKTKSGTIETDIQSTLVSSETASLVNKIAEGGVKAVRDLGVYLKAKIQSTVQSAPAAKEQLQQSTETAVADTKKAIQKIEASVKTAVRTADDEVEEVEEVE